MYSIRRCFGIPRAMVIGLSCVSLVSGCAGADEHPPLYVEEPAISRDADVADETCVSENTGCPCAEPGKIIDCGRIKVKVDDYETCFEGSRLCGADGTWGQCVPDQALIGQ